RRANAVERLLAASSARRAPLAGRRRARRLRRRRSRGERDRRRGGRAERARRDRARPRACPRRRRPPARRPRRRRPRRRGAAWDVTFDARAVLVPGADPALVARGVSPQSGEFLAWRGGIRNGEYGFEYTTRIEQSISIPANATRLTFSGCE